MTNNIAYFKEQFDAVQTAGSMDSLAHFREKAFQTLSDVGIPAAKHEEWKYTRISSLFNKNFHFPPLQNAEISVADMAALRLPGHEAANELIFINGKYSASLSTLRSASLEVMPLDEAAGGKFTDLVLEHLGHSSLYLHDGINALSMALTVGGVFINVAKGKIIEHPVYIYNITDARTQAIFSQPRSLVYMGENAQLQIVETFATLGSDESFTNQVMEIVVEEAARLEYYKIQNDAAQTNQVSTTHIRQTGKSYTHAVTISLNGGIVRNNTNVVLEAEYCEAHLYGLYFQQGKSHIDNHTVVDNVMPNCYSNELYKGMMNDDSSGVFNGKIFVRADAQKTNAYQSNKNVLLSANASVNTKPQLEIYADDVKCSHGCTIGQLDEEGLFYLQSRGIPEAMAKAVLLQSFSSDILEKINLPAIRSHVDQLISQRLELLYHD